MSYPIEKMSQEFAAEGLCVGDRCERKVANVSTQQESAAWLRKCFNPVSFN